MAKFIISFILFTLFIAVPPYLAEHFFSLSLLIEKFWVIFLFFALLTFVVVASVLIAMRKESKTSVQVFMIATIGKLLACMIFALLYLSKFEVDNLEFIACFFYLYFLNTAFEIYTLLCNLRHQILK
jgi:hypothetical protein